MQYLKKNNLKTMNLFELFLKCLDIYFWVFIIFFTLSTFTIFTDEYQENKVNAIKNGIYFDTSSTYISILGWVLFILSIQLT